MRWFRDHVWFLIFVSLALIAYAAAKLFRVQPLGSFDDLKRELETERKVIEARAEAAKQVAALGKEETTKKILQEHQAAIQQLDQSMRAKVEELSSDPETLVGYIIRVTG